MESNVKPKQIVLPDPFQRVVAPVVIHVGNPDKRMAWLVRCESPTDGTPTVKSQRFAKTLEKRKTKAEIRAESILADTGIRYIPQKPFGKYIADYYIPSQYLIIEIDGGIHDDLEVAAKDLIRDSFLRSLGLKVVRIKNQVVLGKNGPAAIEAALENHGRRLTKREREALRKDASWGPTSWQIGQKALAQAKAEEKRAKKRFYAKLKHKVP